MAQAILLADVEGLGENGTAVEVSPGYLRNFLQPRGLAVVAGTGTLKKREEDLEALKRKAEKVHQEAVDMAEKITNVGTIKISARVGDGGKLYGKVTHKEIAALIEKEVGSPIDKRLIKTNEEITALGTYKVFVKTASDVQAELDLEVQMEGAAATA